mmetsp:Transcript_25736/g.39536  ORF Transcript_25736/g.39536 Transcript_25736/m.39536 type:complete len:95 (+) Transcript_25736:275-559(+)
MASLLAAKLLANKRADAECPPALLIRDGPRRVPQTPQDKEFVSFVLVWHPQASQVQRVGFDSPLAPSSPSMIATTIRVHQMRVAHDSASTDDLS